MNKSQRKTSRFWRRWEAAGALHRKTISSPWLAERLDEPAVLELRFRNNGRHSFERTIALPGTIRDYVKLLRLTDRERRLCADPVRIDEAKILDLVGANLPVPAKRILFCVEDCDGGSSGLDDVSRFRPWAKYFPAYSLKLAPVIKGRQ